MTGKLNTQLKAGMLTGVTIVAGAAPAAALTMTVTSADVPLPAALPLMAIGPGAPDKGCA